MKWIPFEHMILKSPLSPEEVSEHVIRGINETLYKERSGFQRFLQPLLEPSFAGLVKGNRFKISRSYELGKSYGPVVIGKTTPTDDGGSFIDIRLRLPAFILFFTCIIMMPLILFLSVSLLIDQFSGKTPLALHYPIFLLALGYGLVLVNYNAGRKSMLDFLFKIIKAEKVR